MTPIKTRPAAVLAVAAIVGALFFLVAPSSPAAAQTCPPGQVPSPPYGCIATTTTTTSPGLPLLPNCVVSNPNPAVGTVVDIFITNVPLGLNVSLLLDGAEVDSAVASTGDEAALGLESGGVAKSGRSVKTARAQGTFVDVHFRFTVPALAAGNHTLVAVGPGFRCECSLLGIAREVGGTNTNRDNLARTGLTVLGLLIAAAVLLVVGRAMVESGRRRKTA